MSTKFVIIIFSDVQRYHRINYCDIANLPYYDITSFLHIDISSGLGLGLEVSSLFKIILCWLAIVHVLCCNLVL